MCSQLDLEEPENLNTSAIVGLLSAWKTEFGERLVAQRELEEYLNRVDTDGTALKKALLDIAGEGNSTTNCDKLYRWLSQHKGETKDGISLEQGEKPTNAVTWWKIRAHH